MDDNYKKKKNGLGIERSDNLSKRTRKI